MNTPTVLGFIGMPGTTELVVIGVVALLIFGKRLPEVARSLGQGLVEFKKGLADVESEIDRAASTSSYDTYDTNAESSAAEESDYAGESEDHTEADPYSDDEDYYNQSEDYSYTEDEDYDQHLDTGETDLADDEANGQGNADPSVGQDESTVAHDEAEAEPFDTDPTGEDDTYGETPEENPYNTAQQQQASAEEPPAEEQADEDVERAGRDDAPSTT